MRRSVIIVLVLLSVVVSGAFDSSAAGGPLANRGRSGLYVRSLEQVLRLPSAEIDLATAVLITSERWSDFVQGRKYISRLDDMAYELRGRLERQNSPVDFSIRAVRLINQYLFDELGYEVVKEASSPSDLFLHSVMDNRRGYCLSLSVLYLSLSERLGLPVYGVVAPGHFFVRYDDGRVRFNIETTSKGGKANDEHYIKKFKVPADNGRGIYMVNLDRKQVLGCFFNNLGNAYSEIGRDETALDILSEAVDINPELSELWCNLGNIYLEAGKTGDAIKQYLRALEINPSSALANNNLGNAYMKLGLVDESIGLYELAIELDPNLDKAYENLANAYMDKAEYVRAERWLKKAIILEPRARYIVRLGDLYRQTKDYESAIEQYNRAIRIDEQSARAYYGLGMCYHTEDSVSSEEAYKKAVSIDGEFVAALVNLGNIYFERKQYDEAVLYYRRAAEIEPNDALIWYNTGGAYFNKGDYEQAAQAYSKTVAIDAGMSDAHKSLAMVYYKLGEYELAEEHLTRAEQLGESADKLRKAIEEKI